MSLLPCTTWSCWNCMIWTTPGCSACVDGVDLDHVAACAECRITVAELAGGGAS